MCLNIHFLHQIAALYLRQSSIGDARIRDHEVPLVPTTDLGKTNPNMFRLLHLLQLLGQASEERNIGVEIYYHQPVVCCTC